MALFLTTAAGPQPSPVFLTRGWVGAWRRPSQVPVVVVLVLVLVLVTMPSKANPHIALFVIFFALSGLQITQTQLCNVHGRLLPVWPGLPGPFFDSPAFPLPAGLAATLLGSCNASYGATQWVDQQSS